MEAKDIAKLLTGLSFKGVVLFKMDEKSKIFKYTDYDPRKLKGLAHSVVEGKSGEVNVYKLPEIGRFGVSHVNSMVQFIPSGNVSNKIKTDDSHLGKVTVNPGLSLAYEKAKVNPIQRTGFMKKLWAYFNQHKFASKMEVPHFLVSPKPPKPVRGAGGSGTPRGVYYGGPAYTPGELWIADFMFNAREPFFMEVFLHEMCHQSTWTIDKYRGTSAADAHGKVWGKWMTHVGLDPRRFDPTDDIEYSDTATAMQKEAEMTEKYGRRVDPSYFAEHKPVPLNFPPGTNIEAYFQGRALAGVLRRPGTIAGPFDFTFRLPNGNLSSLRWKKWPVNTFFLPKK